MKKKLKKKVKNLPPSPGVYLFKDKEGKILYIGKAFSLSRRVSSYFQEGKPSSPKISRMVSQISDLDFIETPTETEALLLESNLIKEFQPKYNLNLKDGKIYPLLKLTKEDFPSLSIVREKKEKDAYYFGPFTEVWALRRAVKYLRRLFPLRRCHKKLDGERKFRPCLDFHLGLCSAPCAGKIEKEDYQRISHQFLSFFYGKRKRIMNELKEEMKKRVEELNFEEASRLRNRIEILERVRSKPFVGGGEKI